MFCLRSLLFFLSLSIIGCSSTPGVSSKKVYATIEGDWVLKNTTFGSVGYTFKIEAAPIYKFSTIDAINGDTMFFECVRDMGDGVYAYKITEGVQIRYLYIILKDAGMRLFSTLTPYDTLDKLLADTSRDSRLMAVRE